MIITELGKLKVLLWPDTRDDDDKDKAKGGRYTWRPVSKSRLGRLSRWMRLKLAGLSIDEVETKSADPKGNKDKENGGCCNCTWACPKLNCNQTLEEKMDSCEGCSSCVPCSHFEPCLISDNEAKSTCNNICSDVMCHCCGAGGQTNLGSASCCHGCTAVFRGWSQGQCTDPDADAADYDSNWQTDPCCPCESRSAAAGDNVHRPVLQCAPVRIKGARAGLHHLSTPS